MRRLLLGVLFAALVVLVGCAPEPTPGPAGPATALTIPPSTSAPSAAGSSGDSGGGDVAQCAGGDCEVSLTEDTDIEVNGATVRVSDISDGTARLRIEGPQGNTSTSSGGSALVINNDLTVRMQVDGVVATLEISSG